MIRARAVFALAAALALAAGLRDATELWIARTDLPALAVETSVEVTARDGSLLRAYTVADGRWRMRPGAVDPLFLEMLIGWEDRRFRDHAGVDPRAMLRAGWQALRAGRVVSGGSTLTMQVARLLEQGGTGRLSGKLRQLRVALALERRLTKDQILDLYLRLAPYGGNIEGLRAATLVWLGKEPARLTPAEAALLVALPQAPEARRPDRAPGAAEAARDRVLGRMAELGVITPEAASAARTEPVPRARRAFPALAPHLADRLRAADPLAGRHATTIDARLQAALERVAAEAVRGREARLSAAIVLADHRTGEILASVGGAAWGDPARGGYVDLTRAVRSPGSTLKPFVYALAFDDGLAHPETLIEDRPMAFGGYAPQNFDGAFRGTVRLAEALEASLNLPVVALTEALGPVRLVAALKRAGVRPEIPGRAPPGLAVALGGVGMSLEDLVQAYAALARLGDPVALHVTPGAPPPPGARLFGAEAAWQVGHVLAGIAPPGGGAAGRIAWKTGTSYGHRDAWALGFDGGHVAGVWLGRADGTPVPGAFGADLAAPVLFQVFARAKPAAEPLPAPPPGALLLPNRLLPAPLRHFRPRGTVETGAGPDLAFPPEGAVVELLDGTLAARVRGGQAPYTWLANGVPLAVADRAREVALPMPGPGFVTLTVIDAAGRADSAAVELAGR
ncbi:MAG: penicillin-binding protein 1C [Rhodobacteraceae bacterium]|nr:penicillin-binding protein 1C [Paracoccaceae bacterium]